MMIFFGALDGVVRFKAGAGNDMMDEVGVNLIAPGDKVLVIRAGFFGELWARIAKTFGADVQELSYPLGETFRKEDVERALLARNFKMVLMQETETSTGTKHDTGYIGNIIREHALNTLLVVDAIFEAFVSPINMEAQNIHVLVGVSQKALMQPPAMGFSILRPQAIKLARKAYWPSHSHSYQLDVEAIRKDEVRYTPPANHIAALYEFLSKTMHSQKRLERWYGAFEARANWIRKEMYTLGFKLFTKNSPSNGMSALELPDGWDIKDYKNFMLKRNIWISGPIDDVPRPYIRLAHFIGITNQDFKRIIYWTKKYKELKEAAH